MTNLTRRTLARSIAGLAVPTHAFRGHASASMHDLAAVLKPLIGERIPRRSHITIDMSPLSESGNSVPIGFTVQSPMTEDDHVSRAHVIVIGNPEPIAASFDFTRYSPAATVNTRIRLARSQDVHVLAETNTGNTYLAHQNILVTLGACVDDFFI